MSDDIDLTPEAVERSRENFELNKVRMPRIEGNIAYVPLTQGYEAVIDVEKVPLVCKYNWFAVVKPHTVYAARTDCSNGRRKQVRMHRFIINAAADLEVDHRDCNGLNNRENNIRESSRSQNQCNQRPKGTAKSKLKGASWHKSAKKWSSAIRVNGKRLYLGLYDCEADAHTAYRDASKKYHGEFGRSE
jgi:hypothetical protein